MFDPLGVGFPAIVLDHILEPSWMVRVVVDVLTTPFVVLSRTESDIFQLPIPRVLPSHDAPVPVTTAPLMLSVAFHV